MLYKNTFKLLFSNASLIWKVLLYVTIAADIILGLAFAFAFPIYKALLAEDYFIAISDTYSEFLNGLNLRELFINIGNLGTWFVEIITTNMSTLLVYIILFLFVIMILGSIFTRLYHMSVGNVLNYYMNSNVKQGFTANLFNNFNKNFRYQLVILFTILPINLLFVYILCLSFSLFGSGGIMFILSPFIIILLFTLLSSLKTTLFCGWLPAMVTSNKNVFGGLKRGFVIPARRFWQTYSNSIALTLTIIFINLFGGICTFGVALIITIPVSLVLPIIFGMVSYYTAIGQRFYVDTYNVIAPKTMELTEKFKTQKYIV